MCVKLHPLFLSITDVGSPALPALKQETVINHYIVAVSPSSACFTKLNLDNN
jgi:hypothetical protein